MNINTDTIRKITSTGTKMIFSKTDKYDAEEGTIQVSFKTENDLSNYSMYLYEDECDLFDKDGDEIFSSTELNAFEEAVGALFARDKEVLKAMMRECLKTEDLDALEDLINLI